MSTGRYPIRPAFQAAQLFSANLAAITDQRAIVGSIRRHASKFGNDLMAIPTSIEVGDVEMVIQLKPGESLDARLKQLGTPLWMDPVKRTTINGPRHKKLGIRIVSGSRNFTATVKDPSPGTIPLDLYIADGSNWGYIVALRTGPQDADNFPWNQQMVTPRSKGGLLPDDFALQEGHVYRDIGGMLQPVEVPTEKAWFQILGLPYVPAHERNAECGRRLRRNVLGLPTR